MSKPISFGAYVFGNDATYLADNFSDSVPRTNRLPGMIGGYDLFADDPAPTEIGKVTIRLMLVADTPAVMQAKRDAIRAMSGYGRQTLTIQTSAGVQRWTKARVNSITMPDTVIGPSARYQDVAIDFQVSAPRWYSTSATSPQTAACTGTSTTFTLVNNGNAIAVPVITVDPGATLTSGIRIQRLVSAVVIDEVDYDASLIASDTLVIDCGALSVKKNGSNAYTSVFSADHPAWMRLLPGSNDMKVILTGVETADVIFAWADTWY